MKTPNLLKQKALLLLLLTGAFTACHKPEPGVVPSNGETTDTLVKKYLVKTFISNPDQPEKTIEWQEGFRRIKRIVTKPGNPSFEVTYDFEYYGDDSLRVTISLPEHSSLWFIGFSNYTCHLHNGRITTVDYYLYNTFQYTEKYTYDEKGRLISVLNNGEHPHGNYYEWNDENVCKIKTILPDGNLHEYHDFCEHIDPEHTMPFVLFSGWTSQYGDGYLTKPLWRNWRKGNVDMEGCKHRFDEDGYVTLTYTIDHNMDTVPFLHYVYSK